MTPIFTLVGFLRRFGVIFPVRAPARAVFCVVGPDSADEGLIFFFPRGGEERAVKSGAQKLVGTFPHVVGCKPGQPIVKA